MPDIDKSYQELIITNFGLSPSGYTGSRGDVGYVGSAGAGTSVPTIASIGYVGDNTATDTAGGETITLTGTGFAAGCAIIINSSPVGVVTFVSSTQVTFVAPALGAGTYILYLVNSNGSTAISVPGISYSGTPSFYTGAGSVGTVYETNAFNSNVAAVGDATITYSVAGGSLPTGATLNANGVITGTSVLTGNITTYTFGVKASDSQNQDVTRTYTITVNPDTVTWLSPANGATISLGQGSSSSTTLTATSAAGSSITYTANTLPTGLSIVGSAVTGTPTVLGNTTTLLTANATSTTRSAAITVTWNVAVTNEPYFMYNSLLLSGNGSNNANNNTFVDSSTNNFSITRAGNPTQGTFSPYGANWSIVNPNTADTGIGVATNSVLNLGTSNFTIECWINLSSMPTSDSWITTAGGYQALFATGPQNSGTGSQLYIGTTNIKFDVVSDGSGPINVAHGMTTGVWYHIALTRSGNTIRLYKNGTLLQSGTDSNSMPSGYGWGIARAEPLTYYSGGWFHGYMSNFRLVRGTVVYTSGFTPPTTPLTAISGTQLLLCQSNRYVDNSPNNFSVGVGVSRPSIQRFSPFGPSSAYSASNTGGSAYFDGSGDYLTVGTSVNLALGTSDFTVEMWVYLNSGSTYQYVLGATGNGGMQIGLNVPITGTPTIAVATANGSWILNFGASILIPSATWAHLAVTRSGSTNRAFINGAQLGSSITDSTNWTFPNNTLQVGATLGAEVFGGYISNFRMVKGTAVYTTTFTPPSAPVTAVANTSLLLNFTNADIIDSAMQHNIETVGDAKISTAQSKFGVSSMLFDGTGDYLTTTLSPNLQFGTGDFTVECWTYLISKVSNFPCVWGNYNNYTTSALSLFAGHNSGTTTKYQVAVNGVSFPVIQSTTSIAYNTWVHLAVVRNSGTITLYVDGVANGTYNASGIALNGVGSSWGIGTASDNIANGYINGYIDDFRVTKGFARYTGNFTPPTAALSTQ